MRNQSEFRKMNVYFFGNEEEKRDFYLNCILPFFRGKKFGSYFATREWNGGPNVEIVYAGESVRKKELNDEIKAYLKRTGIDLSREEIENNLKPYHKNQGNLVQMEKKEKVEIDPAHHLKVTDRQLSMRYYKKVYNSSKHMKVHFESRFALQDLVVRTLERANSQEMMNMIIMKMCQIVLSMYEYGEKYASMVFFSNLMGVYAVAAQYQKKQAFQDYFEKEFQKYDMKRLEEGFGCDDLMEEYKKVWEKIYENCVALVDGNGLTEKGFYQLADQEKQMKKNIAPLESEFHQKMLQDDKLHEMVSGRTHLIFRSMVNILYNIMPSLQVSFLQKNFCIYGIVEYIKEKYNTDWDSIMKERQIS